MAIHVKGGPGVGASRWLYTTNPVYTQADPAVLYFLTLGFLVPKIAYERV